MCGQIPGEPNGVIRERPERKINGVDDGSGDGLGNGQCFDGEFRGARDGLIG
jgi:hypothetical protein